MGDSNTPKGDINWKWMLGLFGAGNLAIGIWMLVDPIHWYHNLPANVPATGPPNAHFIRDIGCVFSIMGVALGAAAMRPSYRMPVMIGVTAWHVAHALVHVFDTTTGLLPPEQWLTDLPGVYGSAVLVVGVTIALGRSESAG